MSKFLITSLPRSGSLFLAINLNLDKCWTVKHEPDPNTFGQPRKRFHQNHYGEVNPQLCRFAADINVDQYGFIFRDPVACFISFINWNIDFNKFKKEKPLNLKSQIELRVLRWEICAKAIGRITQSRSPVIIDFEKMVSDREYLDRIAKHFGIKYIDPKDFIFQQVHHREWQKYKTIEDFGENVAKRIDVVDNEIRQHLKDANWI